MSEGHLLMGEEIQDQPHQMRQVTDMTLDLLGDYRRFTNARRGASRTACVRTSRDHAQWREHRSDSVSATFPTKPDTDDPTRRFEALATAGPVRDSARHTSRRAKPRPASSSN